ncbi:hypothetical protein [Alcanivorax xiamenensis]|uniref:hypothetical protein n=1 Tax=Alcanivorax xiamenensis TaxID=1177156 RepID=UPI0013583280|nr:hypothetical protein [Alcanivorax xiamenensis]
MSPLEKIQDSFFEHIGTAAALIVTGLIGWLSLQVAPIIAPVIKSSLPLDAVLAVLGLSLFLNVGLTIAIWRVASGRPSLRLRNGILWDSDKNPHCPVCKNGGLHYGEWSYQLGYFCNSCNKTFGLTDASGKDVKPAEVIATL